MADANALLSTSIATIARALREGGVTAAALLEVSLSRIQAEGMAFTKISETAARQSASESDMRLRTGYARSLLEGVPVSVKDLFDVAGEITCAGSIALKSGPPAKQDAVVVAALRAAGAVIVGRTHMSEYAFTGLGDNPHFPRCSNPHDGERLPGGSSSGAAVSVGLGQVAAGIGTDTGGSVRIPASFCGLTGFKPTQARVSRDGAFVLSQTQDSIGPIARTVDCCAVADAILAGEHAAPLADVDLTGLRLGVPQNYVLHDLSPEVERRFQNCLQALREAGASVEAVSVPEFDALPSVFARGTIVNAEAFKHHSGLGLMARRELYDPMVLARIDIGGRMSADDIARLFNERARLIARVNEISRDYDGLVLPTTPQQAPRFDDIREPSSFGKWNALALRNTSLFNFLDRCAISLPMPGDEALPAGFMIVGERMGDRRLLAVAKAVERIFAN